MTAILARVPFIEPIWRYRAFIWSAATRDLKLQSSQSLLGILWPVLSSCSLIILYMTVFVEILKAKMPGTDDSLSYAIYLCIGIITWTLFSNTLVRCLSIFNEHGALLKRGSFPKISLPLIVLLSNMVQFAIMFGVFVAVLLVLGRFPGWAILGLVPLLAIQQMIAIGLGITLGTLNVFFRDVGQVVGIMITYWFWLTPIVYPVAVLPNAVREAVTTWNPLSRIMMGYQQIILTGTLPSTGDYIGVTVLAFGLVALGYFCFKRLYGAILDYL